MLEAFYANLEAKSANDTELKLLRAQWDFDKQLLENALQHVGSLFNHFSRHDSSHSRKILVNIGKLLGGKLNELSATDTWLILEGAFLHDTGMLASYDDLQEIATSSEFWVLSAVLILSHLKNYWRTFLSTRTACRMKPVTRASWPVCYG